MNEMKFETPEKMLEVITSGSDLYNPILETYLFIYNDFGSICVYTGISEQDAKDLSRQTADGMDGSYWGSFLGHKNSAIFDSLEWYKENNQEYDGSATPFDVCKSLYQTKGWVTTDDFDAELAKSDAFSKKVYNRFRLQWLINHGYGLDDLITAMKNETTKIDDLTTSETGTSANDVITNAFEEFLERGFDGEIFPCYNEFLNTEFKDEDIMQNLLLPLEKEIWRKEVKISCYR